MVRFRNMFSGEDVDYRHQALASSTSPRVQQSPPQQRWSKFKESHPDDFALERERRKSTSASDEVRRASLAAVFVSGPRHENFDRSLQDVDFRRRVPLGPVPQSGPMTTQPGPMSQQQGPLTQHQGHMPPQCPMSQGPGPMGGPGPRHMGSMLGGPGGPGLMNPMLLANRLTGAASAMLPLMPLPNSMPQMFQGAMSISMMMSNMPRLMGGPGPGPGSK
jgi:hypothetical protein